MKVSKVRGYSEVNEWYFSILTLFYFKYTEVQQKYLQYLQ